LPVPLEEKIEILVLLCADSTEAIRAKAFSTLQAWNVPELQQVLSSPSAPTMLLEFAATYLAPARKEVQDALLGNSQLPEDLRDWLKSLRIKPEGEPSPAPAPSSAPSGPPAAGEGAGGNDRQTLIQKIAQMSSPEKIKLALVGSQEERMVLVRDANKVVARAVLQSPKLSDQEIESFASMKNVTEEVLRLVGSNRKFMKNYAVIRALVNNPRAPLDVTMTLINRLNERDQKTLTLNRNVPDTLRATAIKILKQKEEAKRVKLPTGRR
jgi:hypothetical protein